jgi:hypothetical protein
VLLRRQAAARARGLMHAGRAPGQARRRERWHACMPHTTAVHAGQACFTCAVCRLHS